jgi:hypothetical protein
MPQRGDAMKTSQHFIKITLALTIALLFCSGEQASADELNKTTWNSLVRNLIQKVSQTGVKQPASKKAVGIRQVSFSPPNANGLTFDEDNNDVADFLQTIQTDFSRSKRKRQFPNTGFLDISDAFDIVLEENTLRFSFHSKSKSNQPAYKGKGKINVEYFFKDNVVLLHGRDGLPSMKADANGNYLLTREAKHILISHVDRIEYDLIMQAGIEESEARSEVQHTLSKLKALRDDIESNTSMLPNEISQFFTALYKISAS